MSQPIVGNVHFLDVDYDQLFAPVDCVEESGDNRQTGSLHSSSNVNSVLDDFDLADYYSSSGSATVNGVSISSNPYCHRSPLKRLKPSVPMQKPTEYIAETNILSTSGSLGVSTDVYDIFGDIDMTEFYSSPCISSDIQDIIIRNSKSKALVNGTNTPNKLLENFDYNDPIFAETKLLPNEFGLKPELRQRLTELLHEKNIYSLLDWQYECLSNKNLLRGQSFIYTAPTSGGKSLVAELIAIRSVLSNHRATVIVVLPYVVLVNQRIIWMESIAENLGFSLRAFYNAVGVFPLPKSNQIVYATIERAASLFQHLIEENRVNEISLVVIDELHMIGDDARRGSLLENMIVKLRIAVPSIQIIGMSATLPNIYDMTKWLDASCYVNDIRPVVLNEFCVLKDNIYHSSSKEVVRKLEAKKNEKGHVFRNNAFLLCAEIDASKSVIVFCATKRRTNELANIFVNIIENFGGTLGERNWSGDDELRESRTKLIDALVYESENEISSTLRKAIPFGIAFHNADLIEEERSLIENAFKSKIISVICATSTLAVGVNLPCARVLFDSPYIGIDLLDKPKYKQMCGRAGRVGLDKYGESFLILECEGSLNRAFGESGLLNDSELPPIESKLIPISTDSINIKYVEEPLTRLILDLICCGLVKTRQELNNVSKKTLLQQSLLVNQSKYVNSNVLANMYNIEYHVNHAVRVLHQSHLIHCKLNQLSPSDLGLAVSFSSFTIIEALEVHTMLKESLSNLTLRSDLHICFLVCPVVQINFKFENRHASILEKLLNMGMKSANILNDENKDLILLGHMLDLGDAYFNKKIVRNVCPITDEFLKQDRSSKKLFLSLILNEIVKETPKKIIVDVFGIETGTVENLMDAAASFSSSLERFCRRIDGSGWWALQAIFGVFSRRIQNGVREELVELVQIKFVKARRARALFKSGFRTIVSVAKADYKYLLDIIGGPVNEKEKIAKLIIKSAKGLLIEQSRLKQEVAAEAKILVDSILM